MLIDTHCHLDLPEFDADREAVLSAALSAGVEQYIVVGFEPERWDSTLRLAGTTPGIYAAIGLHPTEAERWDPTIENGIQKRLTNPVVKAVGETGIDYHWDTASAAKQKAAFAAQIAMAREAHLPFIVHQRKAEDDVLDVLRSFVLPLRGVMHCFTGDQAFASECLDLGLHLGLGGAVTHKRLEPLREAMTQIPLERVVLETDSPYMSPEPHRSRRNEPANVRTVAERLAELRGVTLEEIEMITSRAAIDLFGLDGCASDIRKTGG